MAQHCDKEFWHMNVRVKPTAARDTSLIILAVGLAMALGWWMWV